MFKENILRLCSQRKITPIILCSTLGIAERTMKQWLQKERVVPKEENLVKIADYFGVTIEDLLE